MPAFSYLPSGIWVEKSSDSSLDRKELTESSFSFLSEQGWGTREGSCMRVSGQARTGMEEKLHLSKLKRMGKSNDGLSQCNLAQ